MSALVSRDGRARSEAGERRIAVIFTESSGFLGGWLAALLLSVFTLADRAASVPFLYRRAADGIAHLLVEFVAGCAAWTIGWFALRAAAPVARRLPPVAATGAAILLGTALGSFFCIASVRYSTFWPLLPAAVWWIGWWLLGVALVALARRALVRRVPNAAGWLGSLLVVSGAALHWFALHHPLRHFYGNLHALAQLAALLVTGIGCVFALGHHRVGGRAVVTALSSVLAAAVWIASVTPSFSLRRAALVQGGIGKVVLLQALWPTFDWDADSSPDWFWGVDPRENDRARNVLTASSGAPLVQQPVAITLSHGRRLNLLWVLVDSARVDSFERLLRENSSIARGFSEFASFPGYSSCASRTQLVLAQLLDAARCDPREATEMGRGTLLETLRSHGYRDELFGYYPTQVGFQSRHQIADDRRLVELARQAVEAPAEGARAIFVHLKGGHADYVGPGDTDLERYESQLRASFEMVAALVRSAPHDAYAVVVMGDHGEAFGEHQSDAHASNLYEEVLRTPLLVRSPHLRAGRRSEQLGCPDVIWKTLYALGITEREPPPLDYQFAALELARERSTSAHSAASLRSLRVGAKKVIWSPFLGIWEAYDLSRDPRELENVAETRESDFAALREKLLVLSRDCPPPDAALTGPIAPREMKLSPPLAQGDIVTRAAR
jgi:hypothetical protein